jgi:predicted DNA-binding transcriptional regulator AlpA
MHSGRPRDTLRSLLGRIHGHLATMPDAELASILGTCPTPTESPAIVEAIVAKFDELIAATRAASLPLRDRWLDAAGVGALLSHPMRYVLERLAPRPDFPRPLREGHPRWKASEVLEWAERTRNANRTARPSRS